MIRDYHFLADLEVVGSFLLQFFGFIFAGCGYELACIHDLFPLYYFILFLGGGTGVWVCTAIGFIIPVY